MIMEGKGTQSDSFVCSWRRLHFLTTTPSLQQGLKSLANLHVQTQSGILRGEGFDLIA